jgi:hypothetical protein
MTIPDLTRNSVLRGEAQSPDSDRGDSLQTFGPTLNEGGLDYTYGTGSHRIVAFQRVSSDIAVGHQARVTAFYRRLRESPVLESTSRKFKDQVLRSEIPVRVTPLPPLAVTQADAPAAVSPPTPPTPAPSAPFGIAYFGVSGFGAP